MNPKLRHRHYQIFAQEAPEWLQAIEMELVTVDFDCNLGKVHRLLRAAHSLKGAAATVGADTIASLAHQLEDIFRVLGHPDLNVDRNLEQWMLDVYDYLKDTTIAEVNGTPPSAQIKTNGEIALLRIDDRIGHFIIAGQKLPDHNRLGLDLVGEIFEVDVARSLNFLEQAILTPDYTQLPISEFRARAQVFGGIAELCQLPGFGAIAAAVLSALDLYPERGMEICCFALVDFQAALLDVLRGDRRWGGSPSVPLQSLTVRVDEPEAMVEEIPTLLPQQTAIIDKLERDLLLSDDLEEIDGIFLPLMGQSPAITSESSEDLPFLVLWRKLDREFESIEPVEVDLDLLAMEESIADFRQLESFDHLQLATSTALQLAKLRTHKFAGSRKAPPVSPLLSVRVALERLDRMNNLVGELTIDRNTLTLNSDMLDRSIGELRAKLDGFLLISDELRRIADVLTIAAPRPEPIATNDNHFDSLELDRYHEIHTIVHASIEQIAQIEENIEDIAYLGQQSDRAIARQSKTISHLRDDLMWARMLPIGEIFNRFPRNIHDWSVKYHKPVDLKIAGAGILVDKLAIEKLLDPLVHLLRNAFDHGIEPTIDRRQLGKPERGQISLSAYHQGGQTIVELQDDGRGLDVEKIAAKAISLGLIDTDTTLTPDRVFDTIFSPGFSTASSVTEMSGRGMGLDIVRSQLESIKGKISVRSSLGEGTTFTISIPLTLTIANLVLCSVGDAIYAFPADSIQRIFVPEADRIVTSGDRRWLHFQGREVPIYNLARAISYAVPFTKSRHNLFASNAVLDPEDWLPPLLLIKEGQNLVALEIDRLLTERELGIESLGKAVAAPSYIYGCSILSDGSIVPVIDPHTLIRTSIDRLYCPLLDRPSAPIVADAPTRPLILVADDSLTARQSLCLSLEKSGYQTLQARDGREALQLLQQYASELQLVISDVEMPNTNGFEFLNIRRHDPLVAHIPVVMLTSRTNQKHRQYAMHLGATDYFTKPYLENNFLAAVDRLIADRVSNIA